MLLHTKWVSRLNRNIRMCLLGVMLSICMAHSDGPGLLSSQENPVGLVLSPNLSDGVERELAKKDSCWHKPAVLNLVQAHCASLTDEGRTRIALALTNCHLASVGLPIVPCSNTTPLRQCTGLIRNEAFSAYTSYMTQVDVACFLLKRDVFNARTQQAVAHLQRASEAAVRQLDSLGRETISLVSAVSEGNKGLIKQMEDLRDQEQERFRQLNGAVEIVGKGVLGLDQKQSQVLSQLEKGVKQVEEIRSVAYQLQQQQERTQESLTTIDRGLDTLHASQLAAFAVSHASLTDLRNRTEVSFSQVMDSQSSLALHLTQAGDRLADMARRTAELSETQGSLLEEAKAVSHGLINARAQVVDLLTSTLQQLYALRIDLLAASSLLFYPTFCFVFYFLTFPRRVRRIRPFIYLFTALCFTLEWSLGHILSTSLSSLFLASTSTSSYSLSDLFPSSISQPLTTLAVSLATHAAEVINDGWRLRCWLCVLSAFVYLYAFITYIDPVQAIKSDTERILSLLSVLPTFSPQRDSSLPPPSDPGTHALFTLRLLYQRFTMVIRRILCCLSPSPSPSAPVSSSVSSLTYPLQLDILATLDEHISPLELSYRLPSPAHRFALAQSLLRSLTGHFTSTSTPSAADSTSSAFPPPLNPHVSHSTHAAGPGRRLSIDSQSGEVGPGEDEEVTTQEGIPSHPPSLLSRRAVSRGSGRGSNTGSGISTGRDHHYQSLYDDSSDDAIRPPSALMSRGPSIVPSLASSSSSLSHSPHYHPPLRSISATRQSSTTSASPSSSSSSSVFSSSSSSSSSGNVPPVKSPGSASDRSWLFPWGAERVSDPTDVPLDEDGDGFMIPRPKNPRRHSEGPTRSSHSTSGGVSFTSSSLRSRTRASLGASADPLTDPMPVLPSLDETQLSGRALNVDVDGDGDGDRDNEPPRRRQQHRLGRSRVGRRRVSGSVATDTVSESGDEDSDMSVEPVERASRHTRTARANHRSSASLSSHASSSSASSTSSRRGARSKP